MNETKPKTEREFATEVVRQLRDGGFEAVWAGGCVRDELLGREPKDYDVATSATPDQIRELFGKRRTLPIGAAFGVITVLHRDPRMQIEVATFRCDGDYSDGRRPDEVTFSTMQLDASRRDFTINGLFFDPVKEQVIDFVGGQDDLKAKVVRAIGDPDQRIAEDKLRMLRAVRFAATFGFELEADTLDAVRKNASEIRVVSAERIAAEMRRMLVHDSRVEAIEMLRSCDLLREILPEAAAFDDEAMFEATTSIVASSKRFGNTDIEKFSLAMSALVCYLAGDSKQVEKIGRRWKLSNDERERIGFIHTNHCAVFNAATDYWPTVQRLLIEPHAAIMLDFAEAFLDAGAANKLVSHAQKSGIAFCRERLAWPTEKLNPPPLITGNDLKDAGVSVGPMFKKVLTRVRDAQLLGEISEAREAIQLAKKVVQE